MAERKEVTIHIPWDYLDACNGFAFDIGNLIIFAYFFFTKSTNWSEKKHIDMYLYFLWSLEYEYRQAQM